jgi:hypothetical protein
MVIGGAVVQLGLVSLAVGLLGQPAATAALFAVAWALALGAVVVGALVDVAVVDVDFLAVVDVVEAFGELPPLVTAREMPMMMARPITTMIPPRISRFRFLALSAAALLASRPAF